MNKNNTFMLEKIWDSIQMQDTAPSKDGAEISKKIELLEKQLSELMNGKHATLFNDYNELLFEYRCVCEFDAFSKGIKFATAYLAEANDW